MRRTRARLLGASLLGLALVAASCGGDDSGTSEGSSSGNTIDEGVKSGVQNALGGSPSTAAGATATSAQPQPTSMEAWEALWSEQRAAIVKRIKDNKWGKSADGRTVTGPEGFTIDLSKCPAGWSDTEGLTDTSIKVGLVARRVGHATPSTTTTRRSMRCIFDYYGDKGAFKDSTARPGRST